MKRTRTDHGPRLRSSVRIALVLFVWWMATGAVLAQDETGLANGVKIPDSLRDVDGESLYEGITGLENMPRCLAHESSVPGQEFHLSGSAAGLIVGPIKVSQPPDTVTVASHLPGEYLDAVSRLPMLPGAAARPSLSKLLTPLVPNGPGFVVILVPDDFGPTRNAFQLDDAVFALGTPGGSTAAVPGTFSHGALVLHHLNALIDAMGEFHLVAADPSQGTYVWKSDAEEGSSIIVQGVGLGGTSSATEGITAEEIAEGIRDAIVDLDQSQGGTILGYVVNMSWVLLPCATVKAFKANVRDFATFEQYIVALAESNAGTTPETLTRLLTWVSTSDPVSELMNGDSRVSERLPGDKRLAFVAASGNFLLGYQMLPAAWPNVVGVGAYVDGVPPPAFSNTAEVLAPGAWFKLARMSFDLSSGISGGTAGEISYAGTSFAAPFVSLFTALDMADASRCTATIGQAKPPGLSSEPPANAWLADAQVLCPY